MARPKLSEAEKAEREAKKNSPEALDNELAKIERKQAELKLKKAVAGHPELVDVVTSVSASVEELVKIDEALKGGEDANREKVRASLNQRIAYFENQIANLKKELDTTTGSAIVESLKTQRSKALGGLREVLSAHAGKFTAAGVDPFAVIPNLGNYRD